MHGVVNANMVIFDKVPFLDLYMFDTVGILIVAVGCFLVGLIIGLALRR